MNRAKAPLPREITPHGWLVDVDVSSNTNPPPTVYYVAQTNAAYW
ncbi:MAG: hypothetical protein ACJARS_000957 [bacterium]|jgi:hypothetical protein